MSPGVAAPALAPRADSPVRVAARRPRVLLVNPSAGGAYRAVGFTMAPLGVLCVAAYAEQQGFEVAVDDRTIATRHEPFRPHGFDVVGIHSDSTRYYKALALAAAAKAAGAVVVMGGPHPAYVEAEVLATGVVDYVVRGEGERIFVNLLTALRDGADPATVRGCTFVRDGQLVRTPPEQALVDLDRMPLPARHLVSMERYQRARMHGRPIANVHTSRGCPFKCSFCSSSWFDGVKWRDRSPEHVVDEVAHLVGHYGFRAIAFMDDLFTMDARRVIGVAEALLRRRLDLRWWCFTRADTLVRNPDMVALMARSGCAQVFIGVESPHEKVLRDYNKKLALDMPRQAVAMCRQHGIEVLASYILGDPRETRRDILRTIEYAKRLDTDTAQFSILTPFPGTALWGRVQDRIVDRNWAHYSGQHPVMDLPHVSRRELRRLLARANLAFYFRSRKSIYGLYRFLRARRFGLDAIRELWASRHCG